MILGISLATYTMLHVLLSFVGIGSGFAVMFGFLKSKRLDGITAIFLLTTAATSVTGFGFPNQHVTPGIVVSVLSLLVLVIAILARYALKMRGAWRPIYVVTAAIALYLNVFVLVVQSFEKVPALNALAPTQKEPPFLVAQVTLLLAFIVLTIAAVRRFHAEPTRA